MCGEQMVSKEGAEENTAEGCFLSFFVLFIPTIEFCISVMHDMKILSHVHITKSH